MNYIIVDFEMNPVAGEYKEEKMQCGVEGCDGCTETKEYQQHAWRYD